MDTAGTGAAFSVASGVLGGDVFVGIEEVPVVSPPPGPATPFVNFTLALNPRPFSLNGPLPPPGGNPSPLPLPGATITLPVASALPPGTSLSLFTFTPPATLTATGIAGTVDPGGATATFSGVTEFSGPIFHTTVVNQNLDLVDISAVTQSFVYVGFIAPPPAPKDTTPPVIVPTVSPAPNAAGWNNTTPVTVSWSVTDPESGIASSTGCGTTALTAETGGTKLTCSATNGAGLTASAMVTVKIDTTPPKITGTLDPAANPAGWNKTDVKKTFTCTDNLSGVDTCPSPVTVTAEGETTVTVMATDVAGNVATDREVIKIDKTPPELTARCAPPSRSPFVAGRDDRSGVASVMLTGSAPLKVEEFKTAQTFRILDVAGNSLDATFGVKTQGSSEGREHETEFTLLSLSYNGKAPITPAENELECESSFEKSGALKEFEQKLELEDEGIQVQAKFEAKKNQTRITVKRQGIEQRFTRTGLVFILLTTNKGTLGFEFSP